MGNIQSFTRHSSGYSILQRFPRTRCSYCGCIIDCSFTKKRILNHFQAELCFVSLKALQTDLSTSDFSNDQYTKNTFQSCALRKSEENGGLVKSPSIPLPQRLTKQFNNAYFNSSNTGSLFSKGGESSFVKNAYPKTITDAKQYDFTSNQCSIYGCLFVEHGNLVFQAVKGRSRFSSYINNAFSPNFQTSVNENTRSRFSTFTSHESSMSQCHTQSRSETKAFRNHQCLFDFSYQSMDSTPDSLKPINEVVSVSKFKQTDDLDNQLPTKKLSASFDDFSQKSQKLFNYSLNKKNVGDLLESSELLHFEPSHLNFIHLTPDSSPPPLRLSLPLVTLRRFGFYRNSWFKIEAGRKAPCGEGYYIFRVKRLRAFRHFFEACVNQQKSMASELCLQSKSRFGDQNWIDKLLINVGKLFQHQTTADSKFSLPQVIHLNYDNRRRRLDASIPLRQQHVSSLSSVAHSNTSELMPKVSYWFHVDRSRPPATMWNVGHSNLSNLVAGLNELHRPKFDTFEDDDIFNLPEPPCPPIQTGHNYSNLMYDNLFEYCVGGGEDLASNRVSHYMTLSADNCPFGTTTTPTDCQTKDQHTEATNRVRAHSTSSLACLAAPSSHSSDGRLATDQFPLALRRRHHHSLSNLSTSRSGNDDLESLSRRDDDEGCRQHVSTWSNGNLSENSNCPIVGRCGLNILKDRSVYCNLFGCEVFLDVSQMSNIVCFDHTTTTNNLNSSNTNLLDVYNPKLSNATTDISSTKSSACPNSGHMSAARMLNLNSRTNDDSVHREYLHDCCDEPYLPFKFRRLKDVVSCQDIYFHPPDAVDTSHHQHHHSIPLGTNILHYASLDFSPIGPPTSCRTGGPFFGQHTPMATTDADMGESSANRLCLEHVLALSAERLSTDHWLAQPLLSLNDSTPTRDSNAVLADAALIPYGADNNDDLESDLPSNYVAICQLQTLAMRAVLSATT